MGRYQTSAAHINENFQHLRYKWSDEGSSIEEGVSPDLELSAAHHSLSQPSGDASNLRPDDIRSANRAITNLISDAEYESLISEYSSLVDKEFAEGLTKKEKLKIRLLEWKISSIDDAKHSKQYDAFEKLVKIQRQIASKVDSFVKAVSD